MISPFTTFPYVSYNRMSTNVYTLNINCNKKKVKKLITIILCVIELLVSLYLKF